ncbi:MAG: phosphoribosyltransferase [Dehalobacterium sp.]
MPVHAVESTGKNKLPVAYAMAIAEEAGLDVNLDIVQGNRAFRTKEDSAGRLFKKVEFDGPVKSGYNYIIVDDVLTQGGTTRNLREHIERCGGNVVAVTTLSTGRGKTAQLSISKETLKRIKGKFDYAKLNEAIKELNISEGAEWLTEYEGRELLKFGSVDGFRNRGLAEGFEGVSRDSKGILQKEPNKVNKESSNVTKSPDESGDFSIPGKDKSDVRPQLKSSQLTGTTSDPSGWLVARERGFSKNVRTDENMNPEIRRIFDKDPLIYNQLSNKKTLAKAQRCSGAIYEGKRLKRSHRGSQ